MANNEKGEKPTEQEREAAFAPHHSPRQQPDGDPGKTAKEDGPTGESAEDENDAGEIAGGRGQWNKE